MSMLPKKRVIIVNFFFKYVSILEFCVEKMEIPHFESNLFQNKLYRTMV